MKDVISFLNTKSKELDPQRQSFTIVLSGQVDSTKTVNLELSNVSVLDVLRACAGQLNMELQPSGATILLIDKGNQFSR